MGAGLGGFLDGIVLHQWHHLLTDEGDFPMDTVQGLKDNTVADGFFHVATWGVLALGMMVTINAWQRRKLAPPWRSHFGPDPCRVLSCYQMRPGPLVGLCVGFLPGVERPAPHLDDDGNLRDSSGNLVDPASEDWWSEPWADDAAQLPKPEWLGGHNPGRNSRRTRRHRTDNRGLPGSRRRGSPRADAELGRLGVRVLCMLQDSTPIGRSVSTEVRSRALHRSGRWRHSRLDTGGRSPSRTR